MSIRIEKGVKIPPHQNAKYPWRQMKVGDSFLAPIEVRNSLHACANGVKVRVTVRKVSETQVRVWRIK